MNKKSIFKSPFTIIILFLFSSCSYLTPESSNEYTVTKKSPLVMPPDMNMAPPEGKKEIDRSYTDKRLKESEKLSVEDILTGETRTKRNSNNKKSKYVRKKLVNRILKTKASNILD